MAIMDGFATSAGTRYVYSGPQFNVKYFFYFSFFVFGRKGRVFLFSCYFSAEKIQCFFGTFSFSAENRNSVFGRPLTVSKASRK